MTEKEKRKVVTLLQETCDSILREFAWCKNGTQYVGCGVKTLKEAIEEYAMSIDDIEYILNYIEEED